MYLIVVFIHFATVFVNWAYQWYIICSSSDWVDYKQVGESQVTTTIMASQPWILASPFAWRHIRLDWHWLLYLKIQKGAASYQIYHQYPNFMYVKMRLWEFDDDICDSTAWKAINNCTHIPLRHCVLHSCHWYIQ